MGTQRPPLILSVDQALKHRVWAFRVSCAICRRGRTLPVLLVAHWLGGRASLDDLRARFHCNKHPVYGAAFLAIDVEALWPAGRFWRDKRADVQGRGPTPRL